MILLSTAYFPPIEFMHHFIKEGEVLVEAQEHFIKQSYRNRTTIASSNGLLALSVPLQNDGNKTLITEKKISYAENWQAKHWRAIESSYSNSPYFEYFEGEIKQLLFTPFEYLFELNTATLQTILHILRIQKQWGLTEKYEAIVNSTDLRNCISPKEKSNLFFPEYYQVFKQKNGFIENLSALDLLFNEGLHSIAYLQKIR